jgi:hypothetical protein
MTRALQRVVLWTLWIDALFLVSIVLALAITYDSSTTFWVLLLVLWILWLGVLVTALLAAGRRHEVGWVITFVVLGIIGIACTLLVIFKSTTAPVFALFFGLLQPFLRDNVSRTIVGALLLFVACLLPLPVAALWYGRRLAAAVQR